MFFRSPNARSGAAQAAVLFDASPDSPVSAASSVRKLTDSSSRPSAGILSPALSRITSPGTSSRAGISVSSPSRSSDLLGAASWRSASMERSARYSCTAPNITENSTMAAIATASAPWPKSEESAAAISRTIISTFLNWASSNAYGETRCAACNSFGPYSTNRRSASVLLSPSRVVFNDEHTVSIASVCQGTDSVAVAGWVCRHAVEAYWAWFILDTVWVVLLSERGPCASRSHKGGARNDNNTSAAYVKLLPVCCGLITNLSAFRYFGVFLTHRTPDSRSPSDPDSRQQHRTFDLSRRFYMDTSRNHRPDNASTQNRGPAGNDRVEH